MELREPIDLINKRLIQRYGKYMDGQPNFRVVWSDDQFEKRWTDFTDDGFELINPEVRELPKYKHYIQQRFILERLIPIVGETDLTTKIGYEPAWVFQDRFQHYLPPFFDGCVHVIETLLSQIDHAGHHTKYKDESVTPEARAAALQKMTEELFGNETEVGDHLTYGTGVVVPGVMEEKSKLVH